MFYLDEAIYEPGISLGALLFRCVKILFLVLFVRTLQAYRTLENGNFS